MLVCPDRECGYRKSVVIETNARCPNCHKKLEMRGQGENRLFTCICGHREKLSDFEKRRGEAGANKAEIRNFMSGQKDTGPANSALAEQLAKWRENQ